MLFGGNKEAEPTAAKISDNDGRVKFLTDFGWQVINSPTETGQVRIPEKEDAVYARYNTLQKSQGYDLSQFAGKTEENYTEIDAISGATLTTDGYKQAIQRAFAAVNLLKGGE